MKRYLENLIIDDSFKEKKMAFVYGPRQVGKTTLSQNILKIYGQPENYFNWDNPDFKKIWAQELSSILIHNQYSNPLLIFDEIHKDKKWKNRLKGFYDQYKDKCSILVTGSARLDFFKKSGDSLLGRFFSYRLHPFSVAESEKMKSPPLKEWLEHTNVKFKFKDLLSLGGFPEPFLGGSANKAQRWSRLQVERLIQEDLRDLTLVRDIQQIHLLATLLQDRIGSQLSYKSLEVDLQCSYTAVTRWIELLEIVYYCYRIKPYSKNVKRSLLKEPKLYLYNWYLVNNEAAKYENLIASHLLKACHFWTDTAQGEFELYYLRDKDQREVDFIVTKNGKPYLLAEVKSNSNQIQSSTKYFYNMLKPQFAFQIVKNKIVNKKVNLQLKEPIQIISVEDFLSALV